jgi:hypothetical protein
VSLELLVVPKQTGRQKGNNQIKVSIVESIQTDEIEGEKEATCVLRSENVSESR